jgi:uncharacterized protein YgbK (DUF1537 family)
MTKNKNNESVEKEDLLLTYYGDDLTGSTDSMEALELGGIPTVLFLSFRRRNYWTDFAGCAL